jgi:hypothetical protein
MNSNLKIYVSFIAGIIIILVILFWNSNRSEIIYIKNHVKQCSSELVKAQLEKRLNTKNFEFEGQNFSLTFDTLGKPIFLLEGNPVEEINLKYKGDNYSVQMVDGIITVDEE